MADDKRIRISADTSPLRQLREEAISLYREIGQASELNAQEADKSISQLREQLALMEDRNQLEKLLLDLKRQSAAIDSTTMQKPMPLPERPTREEIRTEEPIVDAETGSLTWNVQPERRKPVEAVPEEREEEEEKPERRPRRRRKPEAPIPDVEPTIDAETGAVTWDLTPRKEVGKPSTTPTEIPVSTKETQKEILREINRHVENIDESVTNIDNSKNFQDNSEKREDNSRREENNREEVVNNNRNVVNRGENITENVVNIERNVQTITENTSVLKEKDSVQPLSTPSAQREVIREPERIERRPEYNQERPTEKFSDENIIRAITGLGTIADNSRRDIVAALKGLEKDSGDDAKKSGVTRYLETIANSVSVIEDSSEKIIEEIQKLQSGRGSGGSTPGVVPPIGTGDGNGGAFGGLNIFGGGLKGILGGLGGLAALNTAKNVLSERYFRNQEFEARSQYQGTVERAAGYMQTQAANQADAYRWIPMFGDVIAKSIERPVQLMTERWAQTVPKYMEGERRTVPYAQVMGVSTGEAFRQSQREGGYAASALGMDYTSYLGRRADLIRSAGGRFVGGNEYDPYAVGEHQSLMAAERLYGLSPNSVNRLQGAIRFGDRDQGIGGSAIIREFEQAMQKLNIPFQEIAATMEEALDTFVKQSDSILSKRGEFNSRELAAVLSGVREATGLSGRQLERVQTAFTGAGVSNDEVTNALMVQSIRRVNPNLQNFSEIQEELEKIRSGGADPDLMKEFLGNLVERSGGGTETLRQTLSQAFTNLSWNDINSVVQKGADPSKLVENIFNKIAEANKRIQETPTEAYDPKAAARTVGAGERVRASDENTQISEGAKALQEILAVTKEIRDNQKAVKDHLLTTPTEKIVHESTTGGSGLVTQGNVSAGVDAGRMLSQWLKESLDKWARNRVSSMTDAEAAKLIQTER